MKKLFTVLICLCTAAGSYSQTVTNMAAAYHDGQVFITWSNIAVADTGFYYVYRNSVPITAQNFQSSTYLGRVPYNSSYDFRYTTIYQSNTPKYFLTNDNPVTKLTQSQGFFVMNCIQEGAIDYYAVRCDYGQSSANWQIASGSNATASYVTEHLDPVKAYLEDKISAGASNDTMLVYVHYGGNLSANGYPAMANEGCLPFHFGLVMSGPVGGKNACYIKFHGGGGDFVNNAISNDIVDAWKITCDDWIPAYKKNPLGENTRWLGYSDQLDVYHYDKNTKPPASGTIKCYTYYRVNWELNWMEHNWPNSIDTTQILLSGSSQGCSGVFTHCLIDPSKFAAGESTDGKFNVNAPEDDNPSCKFNDGNSGRTDARIFWGNEDSTNLKTDIHLPSGTGYYKIYDLTNMNYMFDKQQNTPLPFIYALNGKNDDNTCWEEKVTAYNTIQADHAGGIYYWDLRGHGGGSNNSWNTLRLEDLGKFATNKSYPAFSNCDLDGNPGNSSNPDPPYYSGDDIGTLHGNLNWDAATIKDSAKSWQVFTWLYADTLKDGSLFPDTLPEFAKSDITIRRAQSFKGFAKKQKLYWFAIHNGDTIQHGSVTQKFAGTVAKPLTVQNVKVYPDGITFRIQTTNVFARWMQGQPEIAQVISVFPNPVAGVLTISIALSVNSNVSVRLLNLIGEGMISKDFKDLSEGTTELSLNTSGLSRGMYILQVQTADGKFEEKVVKN